LTPGGLRGIREDVAIAIHNREVSPVSAAQPTTGTILIVDDEVVIAEAVAAVLEDEGYRVATATNGADGLARAADLRPDLVLVDMMMPVMDGEEMCRRLRESPATRGIPVVVMSAVHRSLRELPFDHAAFLPKPFDLDTLLDTIADALRGGAEGL
jgi:CheY-like chemotaxis protein